MSATGRPLRIAICLHGYFPEQHFGTAGYARALAQGLRELGHDPVVVAARVAPDAPARPVIEDGVDGDIPVRKLLRRPPASLRSSFDDPDCTEVLRELLAGIAPDLVHVAHFLRLTSGIYTAADQLGLPVFTTFTDFHGFCHRGTLINAWGRLCRGPDAGRFNCISCGFKDRSAERPGAWGLAYLASPVARIPTSRLAPMARPYMPKPDAADLTALIERPDVLRRRMAHVRAAIAPTTFLRDAYRRNGFAQPIAVVPFGIDRDRIAKPVRDGRPLRIGFIGQIAPHKGPHVLIEAVRRLRRPGFEVGVWGPEDRHPAYARRLRRRAAGHPITFHGGFEPEHIDAVLREIDLLVMPSLWPENAPLTLLQALASHTPVVVADQPGMTEFVSEGVNGMVTPPGNVRVLATRLAQVVAEPRIALNLSATTAYPRTSLDMARETLDLYRSHGVPA